MEEVAICSGRKVLTEVENNILLIVGDPQGILEQQLRPRTIHLLQFIFKFIKYFKNLRTILSKEHPQLESILDRYGNNNNTYSGRYYKNIGIMNDTSRVVRMMIQVGVSPTIVILKTLDVSFKLLEKIYSISITDDCHMMIKIQALGSIGTGN